MSVLHRNDKAKTFKQPMTLQGLKNNSDVVFTESDRKKKIERLWQKRTALKLRTKRTPWPEQLLNTKAGNIHPVKSEERERRKTRCMNAWFYLNRGALNDSALQSSQMCHLYVNDLETSNASPNRLIFEALLSSSHTRSTGNLNILLSAKIYVCL